MTGLNILYAAVWRIFTNWGVAVRISWIWMPPILAFLFVSFHVNEFRWDLWGGTVFLVFVAGSIAGIGWHRFCLLDEVPFSWFYLPPKDLWLPYIVGSLKIMILTALLFIPFYLLILMGVAQGIPRKILEVAAELVYGPIIAGIALILPAVALKHKFSLKNAWHATERHYSTILVTFAIIVLTSLLFENLLRVMGLSYSRDLNGMQLVLVWFFAIATNWFSFIFGVAYLTEMYDVLIMNADGNSGREPST
jgi:hypothetical protein